MLLQEANYKNIEMTSELNESTGQKEWYVEGIFAQADVVNKNRRSYPLSVMESEINNYQKLIEAKRSVGELNHPENQQINLDRITHIVESIRREGNNFIGKAKILNTPAGNIVRGLLEGGVKLGVSTRATGTLKRNSAGIQEVQDDFSLSAIDIVFHPSAPDALVSGLMENENLDLSEEDMGLIETIKNEMLENEQINHQNDIMTAFSQFVNKMKPKT